MLPQNNAEIDIATKTTKDPQLVLREEVTKGAKQGTTTKTTALRGRTILLPSVVLIAFVVLWNSFPVGDRTSESSVRFVAKNSNDDDSPSVLDIDDLLPQPILKNNSCSWSPWNSTECQQAIQSLVCDSGGDPDKIPRILYVGDSTTIRLFFHAQKRLLTPVKKRIMESTGLVQCVLRDNGQRCKLNDQYGLPYPPNNTWISPEQIIAQGGLPQGPSLFGSTNPFCQDCIGCSPAYMECSLKEDSSASLNVSSLTRRERIQLIYGGFLGVEFARDVEMQSAHFTTTQENIAYYLNRTYNDPGLLKYWQKPTCVVNTGHHDAYIPNITQEIYMANVQWYLHLLARECQLILWVATTSPQKNDPRYKQTVEGTHNWGLAVRELLKQDEILRHRSLYIDDFEASMTFDHADNSTCWKNTLLAEFSNLNCAAVSDLCAFPVSFFQVHMIVPWYARLAQLFEEEKLFNCLASSSIL